VQHECAPGWPVRRPYAIPPAAAGRIRLSVRIVASRASPNAVEFETEIEAMKTSRGSCSCTAVRYEITAEPISLFCCHCTDCQTASGSSFQRLPGALALVANVPLYAHPVPLSLQAPILGLELFQRTVDLLRCGFLANRFFHEQSVCSWIPSSAAKLA
jgi:hypothetical protein